MKFLSLTLIAAALASPMFGALAVAAPEIDAGSTTAAITLLSGSIFLLRLRRGKK